MREPYVGKFDGIEINLPYSQAPTAALQSRAAGLMRMGPKFEGDAAFYSVEFRKMYAAILLRERGF